jgi:hypothetical protein
MNLADYFALNRYHGKYQIGDRIIGKWHGIPFVGTVYNDSVVSEIEGPKLSVHSDLPIKYKDKYYNIINPKHKDIRKLKEIGEKDGNNRKA